MVPKLRHAFEKAESLPEAEQEALADRIIEAMDTEEHSFDELFSRPDVLAALDRIATDARNEHRRGETKPLDL
jgi:hypothetical protein